jgi:hypothetical protein
MASSVTRLAYLLTCLHNHITRRRIHILHDITCTCYTRGMHMPHVIPYPRLKTKNVVISTIRVISTSCGYLNWLGYLNHTRLFQPFPATLCYLCSMRVVSTGLTGWPPKENPSMRPACLYSMLSPSFMPSGTPLRNALLLHALLNAPPFTHYYDRTIAALCVLVLVSFPRKWQLVPGTQVCASTGVRKA